MNTVTPSQREALAEGLAGLLRLRAADPTPSPRPRRPDAWDVDQRELDVLDAARTVIEQRTGPGWYDEHLVHGQQRQDLLAWLLAGQASGRDSGALRRRAIDDVTHDDSPAKILRVLREEGFTEAARVPDYGGRDLRLLVHQHGWLAQVEITPHPAEASARVWLSINAQAVDLELALAACAWKYTRDADGRTLLIHGTALIAGTGLRVMCALLRAATLPVTPWRVPALGRWLAGHPRLLPNDPRHTVAAGLAEAETLAILNALPAAVCALIKPDLPHAS